MTKKSFYKFILFISSLFILSCIHNRKAINNYRLMLTVREGIGVTQAEVYDVFRQHFKSGTEGNDIIEVTIISYSSGKESFFYSSDTGDNITRNTDDGSIEALIKVRENNRLVDAAFFKAEGRSKEELIKKIAAEIISSFP